MLTSSSGTNYVPNEHDDFAQFGSFTINTIEDNAILKPPCKFGESNWNPYWVIMLTSSSGTNHVPNEQEDVDQYGSFAIPSGIMPC